ncbi:BtpA/SgcQ family protein [Tractidigestivibacter scatoligenes]
MREMKSINDVIKVRGGFIIGMVHCLPLPGSPSYQGDINKVMEQAVEDAKTLERGGVDAVMVENTNDSPFTELISKTQVAALSAATALVKKEVNIPVGVDASFNDCEASLGIAVANGCDFIRVPAFVDTVVNWCGIVTPCAYKVIDLRKRLNAENVMLLCDIQVKHSNMLLSQVPIEESAKNAVAAGADAIVVTGTTTGEETPIDMIQRVKNVVNIPVMAGSGINPNDIAEQFKIADGAIVGSTFKKGGLTTNPVDYELVRKLLAPLGR